MGILHELKNIPPINYKLILQDFEGKKDLLDSLIDQFRNNVRGQVVNMRKAITEFDDNTIKMEAHKIKGGAANLTLTRLSLVAKYLEKKAEEKEFEEIEQLLDLLEKELSAF